MDTMFLAHPSQVHAADAISSQLVHCSLRIFSLQRRYIPARFRYY